MSNSTPEKRDCQVPSGAYPNVDSFQTPKGITPSELNTIVQEVSGKPIQTPITKVIAACNQSSESPAKKKSIEETKKLMMNFNKNMAHYPKHLTYEGSVVFCVAISVSEGKQISLSGLPQEDRDLILSQLPSNAPTKLFDNDAWFDVEFDDAKDFILMYHEGPNEPSKLRFFNSVIHPQKLPSTNVPVEKEDGKLMVGGNLILDPQRIRKNIGVPEKESKEENYEPPRRQTVAGRNAYEIRSDVLAMALDWIKFTDKFGGKNETHVLDVAKKFYSFVEDRRR